VDGGQLKQERLQVKVYEQERKGGVDCLIVRHYHHATMLVGSFGDVVLSELGAQIQWGRVMREAGI